MNESRLECNTSRNSQKSLKINSSNLKRFTMALNSMETFIQLYRLVLWALGSQFLQTEIAKNTSHPHPTHTQTQTILSNQSYRRSSSATDSFRPDVCFRIFCGKQNAQTYTRYLAEPIKKIKYTNVFRIYFRFLFLHSL